MEWYYILGIISYGIFIIQFILSNFGGDTELDVDFDGEGDFDTSSLLSFKGLIHFAMGFSGWLMLVDKVNIFTISIGIAIGILFMVILYYLYKLCMKFHSEPTERSGVELVGYTVVVTLAYADGKCICAPTGLPYQEIQCFSNTPIKIGDQRIIGSYENGIYNLLS